MPPIWDDRYASAEFFYGTDPNDFLREQVARISSGGAVLSLGEGEGRNAVFLATQGHRVLAVDQSAVGLEKARRLATSRGCSIDTLAVDLGTYRIESGAWDAIISVWCHLPSELRRHVYADIAVGLKPGGIFLVESYTPGQIRLGTGGPKDPDLMPSLSQLRMELPGLVFDVAVERDRDVHEGAGHDGRSAVVQVVARRPG
jgi:SAM-dependent methyltransferase